MTTNTDRTAREIEYLSGFALEDRFLKLKAVLELRTRYMTVCLENMFHPQNASAMIRTCEAFGVQDVHAVETLCNFSPNVRIVRGTDKWVDIHRYSKGENPSLDLIKKLKKEGYRIVATSPHVDGVSPDEFDVEKGKFAIFMGTEHEGLSETVMKNADEFIMIPMYGFVESLNVSVCAAIIVQALSKKLHASDVDWHLSDKEKEIILHKWLRNSIKDADNILKKGFK